MNYEYEIQNLKTQVKNLQDTVIQMARNNTPIVGKVDSTANEVKAITPYTEIKTAYIGDTEVAFTDIQGTTGNLSVFFDNDNIGADYTVSRFVNSIVIGFLKPLEEVTKVTITIL